MLPEIGTEEFTKYLSEIGKEQNAKRHKFYDKSVEAMHNMGVHVTGDSPKKLLDIKRPNEDDEAKKYRLKSYKAKTKASSNKVASVINRIYNERLYSIEYKDSPSTTIKEGEGLKEYLTKDLPLYVSLINYIKSVFTKMHLKDANGAIGIKPITFEIPDTDLYEPIPEFYTSKELVDFEDREFMVFLISDQKKDKSKEQKVIVYDREYYREFFRAKQGDDFGLIFEHKHGFGEVPAFRVGGVVVESEFPQLFESFIAGVLPHWDDAVAMYSDLQASIVNHLYPEKWEITIDCDDKRCQDGKISVQDAHGHNTKTDCPTCQGSGRITTKSPFNVYQVNRNVLTPDEKLPLPPFGYGEKELGSTELLEKLAEKEIIKGYEAVNMDIISRVGENQSGIAKVIDRQDLDGFLDVYSSHIFNYVLPNMIIYIELWRYSKLLTPKQIEEYFPTIKEPTTFDVYSISLLTEEYAMLKEAGVGGAFLSGIQKDIIEKRFADEPSKAFYKTIIDVDPLAHLSNEEMMTNSRVIGGTEMYIHTYAKDLVEEMISIKEDFLGLDLKERKELVRNLAGTKALPVIEVEE